MARLPSISSKRLVRILERHGFAVVRQRGSHVTLRHADGRTTTVPTHGDVPKGTLRAIIKQAGLADDDLGRR